MPQFIEAPDGDFVEFPDAMSDDQINVEMSKMYPAASGGDGSVAEPLNQSWRQQLGQYVEEQTGQTRTAENLVGSSGLGEPQISVADFVPGVGSALGANDAYHSYQKGNYGTAAIEGLGAAFPMAGKLAGPAIRAMAPAFRRAADTLGNLAGDAPPVAPPMHVEPGLTELSQTAHNLNQARPDMTPLQVPRAMDPHGGQQGLAGGMAARGEGIPYVGAPLRDAAYAGREAITARGNQMGDEIAPSIGLNDAGAVLSRDGEAYLTRGSKDEADHIFNEANHLVPDDFTGEMRRTQRAIGQLRATDMQDGLTTNNAVTADLAESVSIPRSVQSAQRIARSASTKGQPGIATAADMTAAPGFKHAGGEGAQDVLNLMEEGGGDVAREAMQRARQDFTEIAANREAVKNFTGKVLGPKGKSDEAVMTRVVASGNAKNGNVQALTRLRYSIQPESVPVMRRGIWDHMGRDAEGNWDANTWAKNWDKWSDNAKDVAYGTEMAREYNTFAAFTRDYVQAQGRLGNPSQSANVGVAVAGAAKLVPDRKSGLAGYANDLVSLITTVGGGRVFMNYMSTPRAMRSANRLVRAGRSVTENSTPAAQAMLRLAARNFAMEAARNGGDEQAILDELGAQ